MSNIIRHKRSNTLGAVPSYGEFTEGEILLNTRDGKAFFKKVMPGSEEIIEIRGTRDTVRPTGQTGEEVVSETGIRAAISSVVQDLIPNYFVTDLAGFIGAYNDIRGNYPGGNIYITGNIIMTGDLTLDLRGISITGLGANWRFYNGISLNPLQAEVFKIIITKGSPVFSGINFWGSNGASGLQLQGGTTRQVFVISPQVIDFTMSVMFRDCRFSDIICGTPGNPIVIDGPIGPSATIHLRFDGCNINTHGSDMALTGFGIQYTSANSSGLISVDIRNQTPSLQSHKSLKFKVNSDYSNVVVFAFNSDETAWIDSDSDLANITRTNTVLQANLAPGVFSPSDSYLLMATGTGKNIVKVSVAAIAAGSGGISSVGLAMPNIFTVANSPLTGDGTITVSLAQQLRGRVLASPANTNGVPSFRELSAGDIPTLPYDNYAYFEGGITDILRPIAGVNNYQNGANYKGLSFNAGANVSLSQTGAADGTLMITINAAAGGGGGLTSVGLNLPSVLYSASTNNPLTANGYITANLKTQAKGTVFASDGGKPYFRGLQVSDIPDLSNVYDKYQSFNFRMPSSVPGTFTTLNIEGTNNLSAVYKGIGFDAGSGISMEAASTPDGLAMLTISATGGGSGGTENTLNTVTLSADSSLSSGGWTTVLELSITEVGLYFLNFHASIAKVASGSATIAARLLRNGITVIGSVETYTSAYRAALSGHGYTVFGIGRETIVALQVYVNSTSWVAKATTSTSGSSNATQLTSIKIS